MCTFLLYKCILIYEKCFSKPFDMGIKNAKYDADLKSVEKSVKKFTEKSSTSEKLIWKVNETYLESRYTVSFMISSMPAFNDSCTRSLTAFTNASFSEDSPADGVRPSASAPGALAAAQPLYSLHRKSTGAASCAASGAASGAAASGAAASGAAASGAASGGVSPTPGAKPRSLQWLEDLESGEWTHRSPTSAGSYVCER
jgi:hypothetical protein